MAENTCIPYYSNFDQQLWELFQWICSSTICWSSYDRILGYSIEMRVKYSNSELFELTQPYHNLNHQHVALQILSPPLKISCLLSLYLHILTQDVMTPFMEKMSKNRQLLEVHFKTFMWFHASEIMFSRKPFRLAKQT